MSRQLRAVRADYLASWDLGQQVPRPVPDRLVFALVEGVGIHKNRVIASHRYPDTGASGVQFVRNVLGSLAHRFCVDFDLKARDVVLVNLL